MSEILKDLSTTALFKANEANLYASSPFYYNLPHAEVYGGEDICWCITDIPLLQCNIIFKAKLKPKDVDRTIESLLKKARSRNVPLRWWTGKDTEPVDLEESLLAHGFTPLRVTPFMAIDLLSMKEDVAIPSNVNITEIKDRTALETWCHIFALGFGVPHEGEPAYLKWITTTLDSKLQLKLYLAFKDGEPVATSQLFLAEGVAGIYYIATLPEARKQGIGTAVTLKPLQIAMEMGYRVGILQSSKMAENLYRKMGFEVCGIMTAYQWRNTSAET